MRRFVRNPYNILIIILVVVNALPILAPVLLHFGWEWAARPIYFLYSFTCHQFAHRSLHIYDNQCAWCSRDMAIWGSILAVAILVKKTGLKQGLPWYMLLPFTVPIALDGGIQTIATVLGIGAGEPLYISTNVMRAVTGAIFGTGLGLWMLPSLYESFTKGASPGPKLHWRYVAYPILLVITGYLVLVGLWHITATSYKPANALDFQVKSPPADQFFLRRAHGSCPTDAIGPDPLALRCFFP